MCPKKLVILLIQARTTLPTRHRGITGPLDKPLSRSLLWPGLPSRPGRYIGFCRPLVAPGPHSRFLGALRLGHGRLDRAEIPVALPTLHDWIHRGRCLGCGLPRGHEFLGDLTGCFLHIATGIGSRLVLLVALEDIEHPAVELLEECEIAHRRQTLLITAGNLLDD